jgi:hypothetical protein
MMHQYMSCIYMYIFTEPNFKIYKREYYLYDTEIYMTLLNGLTLLSEYLTNIKTMSFSRSYGVVKISLS